MIRHHWLSCSVIAASLTGLMSLAQAQTSRSVEVQDLEVRATEVEPQQQSGAEWGLTELEWDRYELLMQGRRGILSPGLDPLTALGVEARTDQERKRYAEMQARFEYERIERELAYQHAYDEAIQRLTANVDRVTPFVLAPSLTEQSRQLGVLGRSPLPVRYDVVVSLSDCDACDSTVKNLLDQGQAMNIWVADSGGDDGRIRSWADRLGIPVDKVVSGFITLNHGNSLDVPRDAMPFVRSRQ